MFPDLLPILQKLITEILSSVHLNYVRKLENLTTLQQSYSERVNKTIWMREKTNTSPVTACRHIQPHSFIASSAISIKIRTL